MSSLYNVYTELKDRPKVIKKAVKKATTSPKKKPTKTSKQSKNRQMAKDLKSSRKLTKAQVEEIRRKLKEGKKVKAKDYNRKVRTLPIKEGVKPKRRKKK